MDEVPTQHLRQGRYISLCTRNVSHSVESHVRKRRSRSTKQGTGPRCWTPIRYPQRPMGSQPSPSPRAATALAAAAEGHDLNFAGQPRGWTLAASASPSWSRAPVFVRRAAWGGGTTAAVGSRVVTLLATKKLGCSNGTGLFLRRHFFVWRGGTVISYRHTYIHRKLCVGICTWCAWLQWIKHRHRPDLPSRSRANGPRCRRHVTAFFATPKQPPPSATRPLPQVAQHTARHRCHDDRD